MKPFSKPLNQTATDVKTTEPAKMSEEEWKKWSSEKEIFDSSDELKLNGSIIQVYTVPLEDEYGAENLANREYRHQFLKGRRVNRGVCCALGLVIALCTIGLITSISGAIYLQYYRDYHSNATEIPHSGAFTSSALKATDLPSSDMTVTNDYGVHWNDSDDDSTLLRRFHIIFRLPSFDQETQPSSPDIFEDVLNELDQLNPDSPKTTRKPTPTTTQSPNDYVNPFRQQDLNSPPTVSDFLHFVQRTLNIPNIHLNVNYDDWEAIEILFTNWYYFNSYFFFTFMLEYVVSMSL